MSQLGGSGSMLSWEDFNFKSSEMARNGSQTVLALVVRWGPWGYVVIQLWISVNSSAIGWPVFFHAGSRGKTYKN